MMGCYANSEDMPSSEHENQIPWFHPLNMTQDTHLFRALYWILPHCGAVILEHQRLKGLAILA